MMPDCAQYREQLAEYAAAGAAGELLRGRFDALQQHLHLCAACRAELARRRQVEAALRNWPVAALPHDMVGPVLAQLAHEPRQPAWRWLPWTIWLPALAIALAVGLALASNLTGSPLLPGRLAIVQGPELELAATAPLSELRRPLSDHGRELFWAIWCGLFLSLAGLGVGLGLGASKETFEEVSAELRARWEHLKEATHL